MTVVTGSHSVISLEASLIEAQEAYTHMPGGNTCTPFPASPFPLTFKSGESCRLTSLDNDVYIDFLGDCIAGIYGHKIPNILAAVQEALANGWGYGGNTVQEKSWLSMSASAFN